MGFGNAIVGGAAALIRAAIKSPNYAAGSAGWQISKDGSAEFNNLTIRGVFNGNDLIINSAGAFLYSPAEAAGDLVVSLAPAAGTDSFSDPYVQGIAAYTTLGGSRYAVLLGTGDFAGTAVPAFFTHNLTSPPSSDPNFSGSGSPSTCQATVYSGRSTVGSTGAGIQATDSTGSGVAGGEVVIEAGQVLLGQSLAAQWNDNTQQLNLPAAGGPFIAGEGFHSVTNPAGFSGTIRVKLLPWNAVWLDVALTFNYSGSSQNVAGGSLPSASYYPTTTRIFPLAIGGTPSGITSVCPRIQIGTSGTIAILVPSGTGTTINLSGSFMYPTN